MSVAIHPFVRFSHFTMDLMDDISFGGPLSTVSSDVDLFRREEAKIGLQLNVGRCEVIFKAPSNPEGSLSGFSTLRSADAILLGAPLIDLC